MKAIRVDRLGGPEVLELVDIPTPAPGPGEVLIRQTAVGVNFIDTYLRTGLYPAPLPFGLGREGAGLVEALGPDVSDLQVGQRVAYAQSPLGAYAEAHVVPARECVPIPAGVDDHTACAAMVQGMTAHYLATRHLSAGARARRAGARRGRRGRRAAGAAGQGARRDRHRHRRRPARRASWRRKPVPTT